jgi:spore germination protein GerM
MGRRVSRTRRRLLAGWALAAVSLLTAACGIPTGGSPTAINKADVPFQLLNPGNRNSTGSTLPSAVTVPESIYLVAPSQTVVAVHRDVEIPATLSEILGALLDGPTEAESSAGLQTFLSATKVQVTATVSGGVATVNFSSNPVQVVGPNQTLAIAQVVYTATEQPGITGVIIQIAGQPISVPTASGADVSGAVDRSSYLPQAPI